MLLVLGVLMVSLSAAQTAHFSGYESTLAVGGLAPADPIALAVDASGDVFVSDYANNSVVRLTPSAGGYTQSTVMSGLGSPRGVALDAAGNVYIADLGGQQIYMVPPSGSGYGTAVPLLPSGGTYSPQDVAVDPYGFVFFTSWGNAQVYYIQNSAGGTVGTLTQITGLSQPAGLAWQTTGGGPGNWTGNLYISDYNQNSVTETTWNGTSWLTPTPVLTSGLTNPVGLTLDSGGNLYIADRGDKQIVKVPNSGGTWGTPSKVRTGTLSTPQGVAVDANGNLYIADINNGSNGWVLKETYSGVNFGTVAVGSTSSTVPLQFTFDTSGILGSKSVLTTGSASLDFADAGGSNCAAGTTYSAGATCTVAVKFTPRAAGASLGAAILKDSLGYVIATGYVYGSGTGAQLAYLPWTENVMPVSGTLPEPGALAVDANRSLFVSDMANQRVVKITTTNGYSQSNVLSFSGLSPRGVAVDGAGNVYIADYTGKQIYVVPWNDGAYGTAKAMLTVNPISLDGVAVDGGGNVYYTNSLDHNVYMVSAGASLPATPTVVAGLSVGQPGGLAFDAAGNLFVSDDSNGTVVELPWNGVVWGTQTTVASGLSYPQQIAVDASESVYVADSGANRVVRIVWTSGAWAAPVAVQTSPLNSPQGVALDAGGNLYIADSNNNRLVEEDRSNVPALNFATTEVTATSTPQTVIAENIGTQNLTFSALNYPTDFPANALSTCATATPLAPGGTCNLSVNFTPTWAGNVSESLVLTDNNLNVSGAQQSISLSGISYAQLLVSPSYVPFSNQVQGTTANAWTMNLSNMGGNSISGITMSIGTVTLTGTSGTTTTPPANTFSIQSTSCGTTLGAYSSCTFLVTFTPPVTVNSWDSYAATLKVIDSSNGTPVTASITGTGTAMSVQLNPSSIDFGTQVVGGTSPVQVATLTNASSGTVNITSAAVSGNSSYVVITATTCGGLTIPAGGLAALPIPGGGITLAANQNCTITMDYAPLATGTYTGALTVTTNGQPATLTTSLTGAATSPSVTLAPSSISFANQTAGSTGNAWTVTLNNSSNLAVTGVAISILGAEAADFGQTTNCPASGTLAPYSTCSIYVTFNPQAAGNFAAQLNVNDSAGTQTATLNGTGTAPTATLAPNSLNFGSEAQGSTTTAQTATLTNTSDGPVSLASFGVTNGGANFALGSGSTCSLATPLAAHGTCTILVTFKPSTTGNLTGKLTVVDSAASSPQQVDLIGTGTAATASGFFAPSSIAFGNQTVGSTSNTWGMTLNNTSSVDMTSLIFTPASGVSGEFTEVNSCGTTLAANSTCSISVTFTPNSTGIQTGSLGVTYSGGGSLTAGFTGTGVAPTAALAPSSLDFGSVAQNSTSSPQVATLTNTSAGPVKNIGFAGSGAFTATAGGSTPCGTTLAAGSSCTIAVTFAPTAVQSYTGTLTVTSTAGTQTVSLTGKGVSSAASAYFAPASISFGNQTVGSTSNPWGMTLNNTGNVALSTTSASLIPAGTAEFTVSGNNCGATLAIGAACAFQVTFTPAQTGARSGAITANFTGGPMASLTGTGVAPTATLAPASLSFGNVTLGSQSADQYLTLTNTSSGALSIGTITPSSGYGVDGTVNNACKTAGTLAGGAACSLAVYLKPTAAQSYAGGTLTVALSYAGGTITLSSGLSGTGVTPAIALSTNVLNFGSVAMNVQSPPQTLTLTNNNPVALTVGTITISAPSPFAEGVDTCSGITLTANGGACTVTVTFTPTAAQSYPSGALTIPLTYNSGMTLQPATVQLTGTGTAPTSALAPNSLNFGTVVDGTGPSTSQTATLSNTGSGPLSVTSIAVSAGSGFTLAGGTCGTPSFLTPSTLPAKSSCSILVTFSPTAVQSYTDTLTVIDNSTSGVHTLSLTGVGASNTPTGSFTPGAINFGNQTQQSMSNAWTITLNNTSPVAMNALAIATTGGNNTDFTIPASPCGTSLAANSTCSFQVTFTPSTVGPESTTLSASFTGGSGGTITASLSGTGIAPTAAVAPQQLDFGTIVYGAGQSADKVVTLSNTSSGPMTISSKTVTGSSFFLDTTNCGTVLAKQSSCTINIYFNPAAGGSATGTLTITDSATGSPQIVPLTGNGQLATQTITFAALAGPYTFGVTTSIPLTATGGSSLNPVVFSVVSGPATIAGSVMTITGAGTVVVAANQAGNTDYSAAPEVTQTITVNKAIPTLTWATPASIAGGTSLSSAQLNASASVTGSFAYSPAAGTVMSQGTQTLNVLFTPNDTTDYTTATGSVQLTVTAPVGGHVITSGSYLLTANPSSLTLQAGQTGQAVFYLQPQGGFTGTVTLGCAGLPEGASCSFSPATLTSDGHTVQTSQMTIQTVGLNAALDGNRSSSRGTALAGMLFLPALLCGIVLAFQRKRMATWSRLMVLLLGLGWTLAGMSGCGANFTSTVTGQHTIQINATALPAAGGASSTQSGNFTLTITQ
jgi:sugar lactone lactonase YvrE